MAALFRRMMDCVRALFWKQEMEITLVGLQGAGKTTLLAAISDGRLAAERDTIPTIGLNTKRVTRGAVSIKLWDIGGQPRFRAMWERYCRGVNAIVFVVDAADASSWGAAKESLRDLMTKPALSGIPLLVLANKNDVAEAADERRICAELELPLYNDREVACYSISAKRVVNVDVVMNWLVRHATRRPSTASAAAA